MTSQARGPWLKASACKARTVPSLCPGNQRKRGFGCKLVTPSLPKWGTREPRHLDTVPFPPPCLCNGIKGDPYTLEILLPHSPARDPGPRPSFHPELAGQRVAQGQQGPISLRGDMSVIPGEQAAGPWVTWGWARLN